MATKPTPSATKKTTAKRSAPTKAAALKALGLTQEDLNAIKELRALREEIWEANADVPTEQFAESVTDLGIGTTADAPAREVERPELADAPAPEGWYARNARGAEVHFRLSRQQDRNKKRTTLKPRGQRGDLLRLEKEDLTDPELSTQVAYGLVEIIPAAEALDVIRKQGYNTTQAPHPALALLRNPKGEEYAPGAVRTEAEYNSQGTVVARLTPVAEGLGNVEFSRGQRGGIIREGVQAPPVSGTPAPGGNPGIISDGFAAQRAEMARDAAARRKDLEGPQAGLGGLDVVVNPVQRA